MMSRVCRIILALVVIAIAVGAAPVARAESIFAQNLLGERIDAVDARVAALGGFVQIVDDSMGVLQYNPAMLASVRLKLCQYRERRSALRVAAEE